MVDYMLNNQLLLYGIDVDEDTELNNFLEDSKTCIYCKETKALENFPKHIHYKDNLDSRCRDCIKKHTAVVSKIRKTAPAKPERCECCNEIPNKWCLDHDHQTQEFRGWLCDKCNTGIGKLGDNLDGIVQALNYLLSRK